MYSKLNNSPSMPVIATDIVDALALVLPDCPKNVRINLVLAVTAQVLTSKRIMYKEPEGTGYANHYGFVVGGSGIGKDRPLEFLLDDIFKDSILWIKEREKDYRERKRGEIEAEGKKLFANAPKKILDYVKSKMEKEVRYIPPYITKGTQEGVFALASTLSDAGFGAILFKDTEFGATMKSEKTEDKQFRNTTLDGYNGRFPGKYIKGENNADIDNRIPCNALLASSPAYFTMDFAVKAQHMVELLNGYARRFNMAFAQESELKAQPDAQKALENKKRFATVKEELNKRFFTIFRQIELNTEYELTDECYLNVFHPYAESLKVEVNATDNELLRIEILSRGLKALRLSGNFAALNHPTEHFIHPNDMRQAIGVIDAFGADFKAFLSLKPKHNDKFDHLFNFFLTDMNNGGKGFTKMELTTDHLQEFGLSRDKLRPCFDEYMEILAEMATHRGYQLHEEPINKNSGTRYTLKRLAAEELSNDVISLPDLIQLSVNPVNPANPLCDTDGGNGGCP